MLLTTRRENERAVKVFLDAVKETPRLYFMSIVAALNAAGRVEKEMTRIGTASKNRPARQK